MLQSERDAERFYEAQRKFEQRQRMIDKGWGDLEAYNALRAAEKKKERIESIRMFLLGGLAAILFCVVFFGTNYLMHGYAI
jgi:regulator of protease activity HflC (stomatin/prohibitin superfamily)